MSYPIYEYKHAFCLLTLLQFCLVSPPPKARKGENHVNGSSPTDVFSSDPFFTADDPFGMIDFGSGSKNGNNEKINGFADSNTNGFNAFNNVNLTNGSVNYNNISNVFSSALNGGGSDVNTYNSNMTAQNNLANNNSKGQPIETALDFLDKKIEEMKVGFNRGILNDDFPLESLDPLKSS